ncbi:MAG: AsmA-like C-terminal region-containing protein [Steroidobacteraceae bacterium]
MLKRALLLLVVLAAAAAGAIYWFFSGDGIRRALEQQATSWLGQPVAIGSATAHVFPRLAIRLADVRIGDPVRLALSEVDVSTGLRALLSRRIEGAEIIVSDSRIDMPLPFTVPATDADAPSSAGGGITVASIDAITLRNITIASRGREIVVSADSSLQGSRLDLSRFTARAGNTSLDASGVVDMEPSLDAKLEVSANALDLDDLIALADAFTPPPSPRGSGATSPPSPQGSRAASSSSLVSGRIAATLKAAKGHVAGVNLTNLAADLVAQGSRVTLSRASFGLFDGRYEGGLDIDAGQTLGVTLTSRITDLDVAQLAAFGDVAGSISGRLSGTGRFTGRGRDMASVLAAANGSGTATIVDGTIRRLNMVRTVILFFGRPAGDAPASQGDRFDRITAAFSLARQVVRTDSFTMQSPDADVAGSGTLTIPTKALDGRADLLLSESLSAQAGTDLVRYTREGKRVVLPATIGGTLDEPRVMFDAAAAVQRGIRNEVERRLKGLFDRIKPPPPKP